MRRHTRRAIWVCFFFFMLFTFLNVSCCVKEWQTLLHNLFIEQSIIFLLLMHLTSRGITSLFVKMQSRMNFNYSPQCSTPNHLTLILFVCVCLCVWISTWGLVEFVNASFNSFFFVLFFMLWLGNQTLSLVGIFPWHWEREKIEKFLVLFLFLIQQQQNIYHFLYCVICVWVCVCAKHFHT